MLLCLIAIVIILAGGYWYYEYEKRIILNEKYNELKTIARLKIAQIENWRNDRMNDILSVSEDPYIRKALSEGYDSIHNFENYKYIRYYLGRIGKDDHYEDLIIVDTSGEVQFSVTNKLRHLDDNIQNKLREVFSSGSITFSDLYRCLNCGNIHLDLIAPLPDEHQHTVAAVVLRIRPDVMLYPLIQSWPTSSRTSETLIVKADGDSVVYLNELRHQQHSALRLKITLSNEEVPAVRAVKGQRGFFAGVDYRGKEVISDIQQIKGTDWIMISKVDREELLGEVVYRSRIIGVFVGVLILLAMLFLGFVFYQKQKNTYKKLYFSERSLNEALDEYRITLYSIGEAVITTDHELKVRKMNHVAEVLTGWTEAEAEGRPLHEVFIIKNEDSLELIESTASRVMSEGKVVGTENHALLLSKNGELCPIADSAAPIFNENNEISGVVLVFRDQTSERAKSRELNESRNLLLEIINNSPSYIYLADTRGNIIMANKLYAQLFGVSHDKLQGMSRSGFMGKTEMRQANEQDKKIISGKKPLVFEEEKIVDSDKLYFLTVKFPLMDLQGQVYAVGGISTDITLRMKAEINIRQMNDELERRVKERTNQLEVANKELEAFAYSVSHDLRAPLRAIDGFSRILFEEYAHLFDQEANRIFTTIRDNTLRMDRLIGDLLLFSKTGKDALVKEQVDMQDMVMKIYEELNNGKNTSGLHFLADNLPVVPADGKLIRQVWVNLISNALKFSRNSKPPVIEVGCSVHDGFFRFFIRDNGVGFNAEFKDKLFGVFQRLHRVDEFEGTGVGLAIVQRIIQRHGGSVGAASETGKGAEFYFTLPLA